MNKSNLCYHLRCHNRCLHCNSYFLIWFLPPSESSTANAGHCRYDWTVTVPNNVTRVIGVNYGALRLITYLGAASMVCGIEQTETELAGRPYAMANPQYANLPVIGPQFGGDPELIAPKPDVVFSTDAIVSTLDSLQSQLGIPVIGIVYGGLDTEESRQTFYDSLTLMGKVMHKEDRATEVINYVSGIIDDLNTRTANIPDADKPSVYVGGLSSRGNHGFTSTSASYAPFTLTNSKNVITMEMASNSTQVVNVDVRTPQPKPRHNFHRLQRIRPQPTGRTNTHGCLY